MSNPILCLDFDGVVHRYSRGWQDGSIYDSVTDGFFEWLSRAAAHFDISVFSSRSKTDDGINSMRSYLGAQFAELGPTHAAALGEGNSLRLFYPEGDVTLIFPSEKPPAFVSIDDRALTFGGDWSHYDPETLLEFRPWTVGGKDEVVEALEDIDVMIRLLAQEHRQMRLALEVIGSSEPDDSETARRVARSTLEKLSG